MLNSKKELCVMQYKSPIVNKTSLLCDHCGKSFKHTRNLRIHSRIHTTNRTRYPCQICNKTFLTRSFLNEHENIHLNTKPFECSKCFKRFYGRANLRQHDAVHNKCKFVCDYCQSTFTRKVNIIHHIKKFHLLPELHKLPETLELDKTLFDNNLLKNDVQCKRCKKSFDSILLLKEHRKSHSDLTKCKICGKIFNHHGSLTYHRRVAHNGEKPYECELCNMKFPAKSLLDVHLRKMHTKETPFVCSFVDCKRAFPNTSALRSHEFSHSPQPIFICHFCAKKFRRKNALKVHLKIHTEERKFECGECGKLFTQKTNQLRHEKTHESKNNCFCKFCGKSFPRRSEYAQHALCRTKRITANQLNNLDQAEEMFDAVAQEIFS